jgi:hypothetical protein
MNNKNIYLRPFSLPTNFVNYSNKEDFNQNDNLNMYNVYMNIIFILFILCCILFLYQISILKSNNQRILPLRSETRINNLINELNGN